MRVYLAGPEVFLPEPMKIAAAKKEICQQYGFTGLFPLDNQLDLKLLTPYEAGLTIYRSNIKLMDSCDLIVANMTPFRGSSMDVGTAFEIGYMIGKGKPVFGYTNDSRLYVDRITQSLPMLDERGMSIESFDMADNLMLEGAIIDNGGVMAMPERISKQYYTDLTMFEKTIKIAAQTLIET